MIIIINNKTFSGVKEERLGTDEDAANLATDFRRLGFNVQRHDNLTADDMHQLIIDGDYARLLSRFCLLGCEHFSYRLSDANSIIFFIIFHFNF